ncbi:MAG: metal ABC transporter ATP-binding protein [Chloroflexota bacterium]|nr:metal ABC transporter ATP-binding protein [Chloroflexota bacterium]
MSGPPLLAFDRVSFRYSGEVVVEEVSLSVQAGEFVGLIGPNGSGKSTLMRLGVGLLRPQSGSVRLFGQPLARFREWPRIGYVPQVAAARPGFPATVREVVSTGRVGRRGLFRRLSESDGHAVDLALESVGMMPFRSRLIGELSGGQHQRVMLARALAGEPELLLLDEPAAGVDAVAKLELLNLLRRLGQDTNLAVVYVSHDFETLRPYFNKIALLNRRLLFFGTREDLGEQQDVERQLIEAALASDHHEHRGA